VQNCCLTGGVVTYQLLPRLQLGAELFHQTADRAGTPATTQTDRFPFTSRVAKLR
jgi:hypothetical protein